MFSHFAVYGYVTIQAQRQAIVNAESALGKLGEWQDVMRFNARYVALPAGLAYVVVSAQDCLAP